MSNNAGNKTGNRHTAWYNRYAHGGSATLRDDNKGTVQGGFSEFGEYRICAFVNITCFAYVIIISILYSNVNYLLLHTHTFVRISRCYMLFFPHFFLFFCLFLLFILHLTHLQIYSIINSDNYFTFATVQLLF